MAWVRRAWVLAAVAGASLLTVPLWLAVGAPPLAGVLALLGALALAGLGCAVAALARKEPRAVGPLVANLALLALPWLAFAAFRLLLPEPCPTC